MSEFPGRCRRHAFTLLELIVVIAVLGVLSLILIPVVARIRASAQSTHCMANLQQIGRAFTLYAEEHRSLLPAPENTTAGIQPWYAAIHPYTGTPWRDDITRMDPVFCCPTWTMDSDNVPREGDIGYAMSAALGLTVDPHRPVPLTSLQQPTRTIVLLELTGTTVAFFPAGGQSLAEFSGTYSTAYGHGGCDRHGDAANYLFADGHVGRHSPAGAAQFLN